MKKKRKNLLTAFAVVFCLCLCGFGVATTTHNDDKRQVDASAEIVFEEADAVKEIYFKNDTLTIPQAKISCDGQQYAATDYALLYPDGVMYAGATQTLSLLGNYQLTYYAENGIYAGVDFTVVEEVFSSESGATVIWTDELTQKYDEDDGGLAVSIPEGVSFTYQQPLNVQQSNLETPIIEFYPHNRNSVLGYNENDKKIILNEGYRQAQNIIIRLTDCYDKNNYVDVKIDWNFADPQNMPTRIDATYVAGANGQKRTSLIPNPSGGSNKWYKNVTVDNEPYLLTMTGDYGTGSGYYKNSAAREYVEEDYDPRIAIFYEAETKRIYVQDLKMRLITDLDDPDLYFTTPSIVGGSSYTTGPTWNGFTTGEVYLSVFAEEYFENEVQLEVSEIYGLRGQNLQVESIYDDVKPTISLANEEVLNGEIFIAKSEPFKVFDATANDLYGIKELKRSVWFNYGTDGQTLVSMDGDSFIPKRVGLYTIEYVAVDRFGNTQTKTVDMQCVETVNGKTIDFQTGSIAEMSAGQTYYLSYTASSLNGAVDVEIYAVYESDENAKVKIDSTTGEFFPDKIGTYEIRFAYTDNVIENTYSYTVQSVASENIAITAPILPEHLIKNATYSFDYNEVQYYNQPNAPTTKPETYVSEDGGAEREIDYENYQVNASQTVQFIYKSGSVVRKSELIPVVDVGFGNAIDIAKYFVGEFDNEKSRNNITFTSRAQTGDNALTFINAISLKSFILEFQIPEHFGNFETLEIRLTDYYNRDSYRVYSFEPDGSATTRVKAYDETGVIAEGTIAKSYELSTFYLYCNTSGEMVIDGNGLGGFDVVNDRVLLDVAMKGIDGESKLAITTLNNQKITRLQEDAYSAIITTYGVQGTLEKDKTVLVSPAVVTDVLSPFVVANLRLSITDADGGYMTSVDGVRLDGTCDTQRTYEIEFKKTGTYTIEYSYVDQAGLYTAEIVVLMVEDKQAPTVILDEYDESTLIRTKAKTVIALAGYTVTDNETAVEDLKTSVIIVLPNGEYSVLSDSTKLALDDVGTYRICYYCIDGAGNYTMRYYTIVAE